MTAQALSESSLETCIAQIEEWKAANPGASLHAVQPKYVVIRPELYQQARNIFARLAWQDWWHTARVFGFRSAAVQTFKGWQR